MDIRHLAERSRLIGKSLARAVERNDRPQIANWAMRQADVSTSLAVAAIPALAKEDEAAIAVPPPNFGRSNKLSTVLYSPWAFAWFAAAFGTVWPDAGKIAERATVDGCLAQVCAAGILGTPGDPGDWSLFTGIVSTGEDGAYRHRVYQMGELIGTSDLTGPDKGLAFAESLGLDTTQ